jgi:NitT/TauT family transport system substrate-binding protein
MQTTAAEADLGLLFFGPKLLDEHTDVGQRFMLAYLEGVRQYQQGKSPRNLEILARHTDLSRETLEKLCWVPFRDDGQPHLPSMLEFNAWAVRKGLVEARLSGPEIFDPRFLQCARAIVTAK